MVSKFVNAMKTLSLIRSFAFVILALASMSLASCGQGTINSPNGGQTPGSQMTYSCVGEMHSWSDGGGITTIFSATAVWKRDSLASKLQAVIKDLGSSTWRDSAMFVRGAAGWVYDSRDYRVNCGFEPTVTETADSLIISISPGYTIDTYYLRKQ